MSRKNWLDFGGDPAYVMLGLALQLPGRGFALSVTHYWSCSVLRVFSY